MALFSSCARTVSSFSCVSYMAAGRYRYRTCYAARGCVLLWLEWLAADATCNARGAHLSTLIDRRPNVAVPGRPISAGHCRPPIGRTFTRSASRSALPASLFILFFPSRVTFFVRRDLFIKKNYYLSFFIFNRCIKGKPRDASCSRRTRERHVRVERRTSVSAVRVVRAAIEPVYSRHSEISPLRIVSHAKSSLSTENIEPYVSSR